MSLILLTVGAVYDVIKKFIEMGDITLVLNEDESKTLKRIVSYLVDKDFQPKRYNVEKFTAIAALSIIRDLGFNIKFNQQSKYYALYNAFNFNATITDTDIHIEEV